MRGFSELVAEAVRDYLEGKAARERDEKRRLKTIRRLRGSLSDEAAERMRAIVRADREEKA
jgi:metal-responsive CopG/Arc/MetJ family transcriptional regulator